MASIVVLGAGLAGRACAWKLQRAGHEVEVLEREGSGERAGVGPDEELGALTARDTDVLAAAAVLGIPHREGPTRSDAFLCNGRFEPLPQPTLAGLLREPGGSRLRRLRFFHGALAAVRRGDRRASSLVALDGASFAAVLSRVLGDDPLAAKLGALAGLVCGEAPAQLSYATGMAALAASADAPRSVLLQGGLAGLRQALAASLTIRLGCEVVSVETESAGARVRYRTQGRLRSVLADAAVVALPAPDLLQCCPKLTPDERGFFEAVETAPSVTMRLVLERKPPGLEWSRLGLPDAHATLRSLELRIDSSGPGLAARVLLDARLAAEPGRRLFGSSDEDVEAAGMAALADTPLGRLRAREVGVERAVSPRPLFRPGAVERIARFERRMERSPRLAFAGRHLLGPRRAAAFTSGLRAATEIAREF